MLHIRFINFSNNDDDNEIQSINEYLENVSTAVIWYDLFYPCPTIDIKGTGNRISLSDMSTNSIPIPDDNTIKKLCTLLRWVPYMKTGNLSMCAGEHEGNLCVI
jgi:hypothetical protein